MLPRARVLLVPALIAFTCFRLAAQEGEEVITLSPFQVSGGESGSYWSSGSIRPNPSQGRAPTAITLRKRAENVALAIALENDSRSAETRNREMIETLSHLLDKAAETPGIRVHNGVLTLSTRDRKLSLLSAFSREPATRVDLYVLGELTENTSALEVTNRIKSFLSTVEKVGATKILEGSVGLSVREPERFRRELLSAIIDDVHFVEATLGDAVEISLSGLDQRVQVRQFNDVEVELSIPYSYSIKYSAGE